MHFILVKKRTNPLIIVAIFGFFIVSIQLYIGSKYVTYYWEEHARFNTSNTLANKERQQEQLEKVKHQKSLLLFIAVLNKISSFDRREALRDTWLSLCGNYDGKVVCKFFTDTADDLSKEDQRKVSRETNLNNDMVFMPYKGALNFSLRLIWILKWVTANYKFDFFLRIDDDHFLCLDRLVAELPHRPTASLYWGFIHCRPKIVRVDEGWMILTQDLVEEALSKLNSTLPCHPYGDQAVAKWMIDSKYNVTYFYDNDRVVNRATAYHVKQYLSSDICRKYLSLHGSYPKVMRRYWDATKNKTKHTRQYEILDMPRYEDKCEHSNKVFDTSVFYYEFNFDMRPCKDQPRWVPRNSREEFQSREIVGEV